MAKEEAPAEATPGEATPPRKGKRKLLIIILLVLGVVVLAAGGLAAWLLATAPDKSKQAKGEEEEQDDKRPPIYERLDQFTVNLADQQSYLQAEIQLLVSDAKVQDKLKQRMPEVRDAVIRLLSSKTIEDLNQPEGMTLLADEINVLLNDLLRIKKGSPGIKKVLFSNFIIQT